MTMPSASLTNAAKRRARRRQMISKTTSTIERSTLLVMRRSDTVAASFLESEQHVTDANLDAKLQEVRADVQKDIIGALHASSLSLLQSVNGQFQRIERRIEVLEASMSLLESSFPSEADKQAFLQLPEQVVPGLSSALASKVVAFGKFMFNPDATPFTPLGKVQDASLEEAPARITEVILYGTAQAESLDEAPACITEVILYGAAQDESLEEAPARFTEVRMRASTRMGMKEFWDLAQLVRQHLPHIPQKEPQMLMLCDLLVTHNEMQREASKESDGEREFAAICENLSAAYPDARNARIANAAMHIWRNGDTDTARSILEAAEL